ncbi:MAG: ASPIC/UnbV domain-containing protein [Gemmataceae bacterium]
MSQPWQRGTRVPQPGKLDPSLGEFWSENPWDIVMQGHNLSAFERKRAFLNVRGRDFLDISTLTGADGDGDGRSVVAGDFRNNGQLDLVLRQCGGGPVLLYENQFPRRHYLKVSLRGRSSNRLGIGARLTAVANGQTLVREMYPINSFRSQMPNIVHFGLGDAARIEQLTVRWPSGRQQHFANVAADRHIVVDEGQDGESALATVVPGKIIAP